MSARGVSLPENRVLDSVGVMRSMAAQGGDDPRVVAFARNVARALRPGGGRVDPPEIVEAAYRDLLGRWVRVEDPYGVERISHPADLIREPVGDCDDAAVLMAALVLASGARPSFVVVRSPDGAAFHVRTDIETGAGWVPLDLSEGAPFGLKALGGDEERYDVPARDPGLGGLPIVAAAGLASAASGLASAFLGRGAAEDQAAATRYAANQQFISTKTAAKAQNFRDRVALKLGTLAAEQRGAEVYAVRESVARVMQFLRDTWPTLALLAGVKALAPALAAAVER